MMSIKKKNNGFGQEKYMHQINVKLTAEDMKRLNHVQSTFLGGEVSGSMLIRVLVRKGLEWYEAEKK